MDNQIELYLDELCENLNAKEERKYLIREELRSHLEGMLEDCPSDKLAKEGVGGVIRREFGKAKKISSDLNKTLKKGSDWDMERRGFIRRVILPPAMVIGMFAIAVAGIEFFDHIRFQPAFFIGFILFGLVGLVSSFTGPAIISVLCFYQGGNLFERLALGLIPVLAMRLVEALTIAHAFSPAEFILWMLFNSQTIKMAGYAVIQLAIVEMWVRYRLRRVYTAAI